MTVKEIKKEEIPKGKKKRSDLPSVDYLLKHGDPETAHIPKTWKETFGYPFALAMVFALSLFAFHNAPWDKLPNHRKPLGKNVQKLSIFDKKKGHSARVPHLNKKTEL
eukprot:CAMPEP_0116133684 /NCGR_PEP_ID=MMETSP0329-20121206/10238_1 /TAXON_ID=697910 /ORGANISM="Pseudo-nitzschia arenysensis, Strain B593" /LENGTH=107 /DNA_ID=CAMNT_0003628333 /DNA_START=96 /DNA_END=419 /DNA_ORIENTATION=+